MPSNPLKVPYIHQLRDTSPDFNGKSACGPTSTIMALAAYGLLDPRNDSYGQYGWYVSNSYTKNGTAFSRTQPDGWGKPAGGAFGACLEEDMTWGWRAENFAKAHGIGAKAICPADYDTIVENVRAGKPVVVGTTVHGYGHVILAIGVKDDGRLIFNDPYWRKPGQEEDVYSWGELGFCPWMMVFDRPLPETAAPPAPAAAPSAPLSGPIENEQPVVKMVGYNIGQELIPQDQQRFVEAYVRNGGEDRLGAPVDKPYQEDGLTVQKTTNGYYIVLNIIYDDQTPLSTQGLKVLQPAFVLSETIYNYWHEAHGGYSGVLKSPVSDEFVNPQGLHQISFETAYITWDGKDPATLNAYFWPSNFNSWKAEYYNNAGLAATPAYIRDEPEISYDFDESGPGGGNIGIFPHMFSARWRRKAVFEDGTYVFNVTCDDGFRLLVDGASLPEQSDQFWTISAAADHTFTQPMTAGEHEVKLEYFNAGGKAVIRLNWQKQ